MGGQSAVFLFLMCAGYFVLWLLQKENWSEKEGEGFMSEGRI